MKNSLSKKFVSYIERDFYFNLSRTLEVTVDIEEKGGKVIKYAYKANKLPGDIDPDGCKTEASRHRVTDPWPVIFVSYL